MSCDLAVWSPAGMVDRSTSSHTGVPTRPPTSFSIAARHLGQSALLCACASDCGKEPLPRSCCTVAVLAAKTTIWGMDTYAELLSSPSRRSSLSASVSLTTRAGLAVSFACSRRRGEDLREPGAREGPATSASTSTAGTAGVTVARSGALSTGEASCTTTGSMRMKEQKRRATSNTKSAGKAFRSFFPLSGDV